MMATPPPALRYIDVHTHLHPAWLWAAIRRWFAGRPGWEFRYPTEPDRVAAFLAAQAVYGFKGFKFHINVQRFHPDDPRILPVYERLIARGGVLLIHVGSAPWPNEYDGFPHFERVMTMFPEMTDFPNTPDPYEEERRPIWERALPEAVYRKIFHDNAKGLLDL